MFSKFRVTHSSNRSWYFAKYATVWYSVEFRIVVSLSFTVSVSSVIETLFICVCAKLKFFSADKTAKYLILYLTYYYFLNVLFELNRAFWIYELYGLFGIKSSIRNWACTKRWAFNLCNKGSFKLPIYFHWTHTWSYNFKLTTRKKQICKYSRLTANKGHPEQ